MTLEARMPLGVRDSVDGQTEGGAEDEFLQAFRPQGGTRSDWVAPVRTGWLMGS